MWRFIGFNAALVVFIYLFIANYRPQRCVFAFHQTDLHVFICGLTPFQLENSNAASSSLPNLNMAGMLYCTKYSWSIILILATIHSCLYIVRFCTH